MICRNCGFEFSEGIFCPECGTKYEKQEPIASDVEKKNEAKSSEDINLESERIAEEKARQEVEIEKQKTEQERLANERAQKEVEHKAEVEKQKTEQERLANERIQKETELIKLKMEQDKLEQEKAEAAAKAKEELRLKKIEDSEGLSPSIISFIMGILALLTFGAFLIPQILGIIFAMKGKKAGKMRWQSKAGMIMSIIAFILVAISLAIGIYFTVLQK